MESLNGSSSLKKFSFSNKQSIMDSTSPFLQSYADQNMDGSKGKAKPNEGLSSHHHRCNSESFLIEEQPSWLDDLLNEPPETTTVVHKGHHRRSASDTFAYLGAAAERLNTREEAKNKNVNVGASWGSVNYVSYKDLSAVSYDTKPSSSHEQKFNKAAQEVNGAASVSHEKHNREMNNSQNQEGSSERSNNVQAKHSMSKADAKRSKQQSAHRSRVRKLQHIAELERTVQALQAEGSELSAELEFLDQQNIILSMENRALRQRLDSLSQEQLIKHLEQEMLERELTRLQTLYQMQRQQLQQQHQQPPQQQNHSKHRRNKSRDLEAQFANLSIKNNEASSSRQVTGSVRM
ncbi:uncharacterized protein At4g06598-like [Lycium barbarum]|uniref:uncharacterized protein At4g06598-like n=1 Tax=Lycium barbarum TaxID=112863 RepID=UPI00293E1B13|nr:uncharacterized protein At4g06598-like [Lycium barbarum]